MRKADVFSTTFQKKLMCASICEHLSRWREGLGHGGGISLYACLIGEYIYEKYKTI